MKLIGMLDSPYVRRVAISFRMQNICFEHVPLSTFSDFDAFSSVNPAVKAPTLVTHSGVALMESGLIIELGERLAAAELKLTPADPAIHIRAQRAIGLALAACEKTVQTVYEHKIRPAERRHQPWLDRVHGQLMSAYRMLEEEFQRADPWLFGDHMLQADVTSAVAFRFSCAMLPDVIAAEAHPALAALSARAEAMPAFLAFPFRPSPTSSDGQ